METKDKLEKNFNKKPELLAPVGSLANLKAAVAGKADAIYLGMKDFGARAYANNFSKDYLKKAIQICKSNNVKSYLTMNTLIKNNELDKFFSQLLKAYSLGIDAVIIQEPSFIDIIKKHFPGLKVHISTQAGVMNSNHANLLSNSDRINLAREISRDNIISIRKNFKKELEMFIHGSLCVCISGSCLFSSFIGGRSGNRGRCAQPCRKIYNNSYALSTRDLCLIEKIPEIINLGLDSLKIEGRMRNPYYVFTTTSAYRNEIDNCIGGIKPNKNNLTNLKSAYSRTFTEGKFSSKDIFNKTQSSGTQERELIQDYHVKEDEIIIQRPFAHIKPIKIKEKPSKQKRLLVKVYNKKDALDAYNSGADIIYLDLFNSDFIEIKNILGDKLYAYTPRIIFDSDIPSISERLGGIKPLGILAGNMGAITIANELKIENIHLDYNCNCFNDLDVEYFEKLNVFPIISPELSINELKEFKNKNFASLVHGKIIIMTMAHRLNEKVLIDEKKFKFYVNSILNGVEITNEKELGFFNKAKNLLNSGINNFYIDTKNNVKEIVNIYRKILDGKTVDVSEIKKEYVLGWYDRGVE